MSTPITKSFTDVYNLWGDSTPARKSAGFTDSTLNIADYLQNSGRAPWYVDPAAVGANNGTSWTNAWTSMATAFTTPVAGDIVYCRGTQVISGGLTTSQAGSLTAGWIRFIGCNSAGNKDGTKFIINANSNSILAVNVNTSMQWFENIMVENTIGAAHHGFSVTGHGSVFINVSTTNCSGDGIAATAAGADNMTLVRCASYNNIGNGYSAGNNWKMINCVASNNGGNGYNLVSASASTLDCIGCLSYNNTGIGYNLGSGSMLVNCVSNNNTAGEIILSSTLALPLGS